MSRISRMGIAVMALAVALAVGGSTALAKGHKGAGKHAGKGGKAGKAEKAVGGKVTAVDQNSITIDTKKHGSKQYQVNAGTTYEFKGKKHGAGRPAALSDVTAGERVKIAGRGNQATKVIISKAKHGGKNKNGKHHKK